MKKDEIVDLLQQGFDRIETQLIDIDKRLRDVERHIAEDKGKTTGLITAKDIFVVLCAVAAAVISLIRLTQ